jgi:hypothetical protein
MFPSKTKYSVYPFGGSSLLEIPVLKYVQNIGLRS